MFNWLEVAALSIRQSDNTSWLEREYKKYWALMSLKDYI